MLLPLTSDQLAAFRAFLSSSEDAEPLGGEEYSATYTSWIRPSLWKSR